MKLIFEIFFSSIAALLPKHRHELFQDCNSNDSKNPMLLSYIVVSYFWLCIFFFHSIHSLLLLFSFRYTSYLLDSLYGSLYDRWLLVCEYGFPSPIYINNISFFSGPSRFTSQRVPSTANIGFWCLFVSDTFFCKCAYRIDSIASLASTWDYWLMNCCYYVVCSRNVTPTTLVDGYASELEVTVGTIALQYRYF